MHPYAFTAGIGMPFLRFATETNYVRGHIHFVARCARIFRVRLYCNRGWKVGQVKRQITDLLKPF
jgi:hypothetical protein